MDTFKIGTTSFVFPDTIYNNCKKLEKLVDEVSIVMFETSSCLNYTKKDLPDQLKQLDLSYNIHLPLDLPWEKGLSDVIDNILKLIDKTKFLTPTFYILHPPPSKKIFIEFTKKIQDMDVDMHKILLENIRENNLMEIWDVIYSTPFNVCLDLGHLIEYNQFNMLHIPGLYSKTKMLHIYSPKNGLHNSLELLDKKGISILKEILSKVSNTLSQITVTIEVFDFKDLLTSLDFFKSLCRGI